MTQPLQSPHRQFFASRHHAWLAVLTLGLGFLSAQIPGLIAGVTCYALGWIFLPDSRWFKGSLERAVEQERAKRAEAELATFQAQRERLMSGLAVSRRDRYQALADICGDIERASNEVQAATGIEVAPRLQKLDELMWTYMRLLAAEQTLETFLEIERREPVEAALAAAEEECEVVIRELAALPEGPGASPERSTRERVLGSLRERIEALRQRKAHVSQASANRDFVRAEQERLVEQVKLIRADAIASRNSDVLTSRIDASIQHLGATNQWLGEMAEFRDLTAGLPDAGRRIGYAIADGAAKAPASPNALRPTLRNTNTP